MLSGQQSCFLGNQTFSLRHMVPFMTEGEKVDVEGTQKHQLEQLQSFLLVGFVIICLVYKCLVHRDRLDTSHRCQRHGKFCGTRGSQLDNCWHACPRGVEVQTGWYTFCLVTFLYVLLHQQYCCIFSYVEQSHHIHLFKL